MGSGSLNSPVEDAGRWVWGADLIRVRSTLRVGVVALDPRDKGRDLRHQKSQMRWVEAGVSRGEDLASKDHVTPVAEYKAAEQRKVK